MLTRTATVTLAALIALVLGGTWLRGGGPAPHIIGTAATPTVEIAGLPEPLRPAAQAEMAMSCVKRLLEEAGSQLDHICKITIYLTDPRHREPVYNVIGRWLKGVYPVSTGLVVQALARPEMLMEIDVDAVIPEDGP